MTTTLGRPPLTAPTARAALDATKGDVLLHAGTSLMLLAGLRPSEAVGLLVRDWAPGDDPRLTVRTERRQRTIRIAPTAAAVIDAYLGDQETEPDEPLLLGLKVGAIPHLLHQVFAEAMRRADLDVRVHDLRRTAMAAVLEDGAPVAHIAAYFGLSKLLEQKTPPPQEGYDVGIAAILETTFAG